MAQRPSWGLRKRVPCVESQHIAPSHVSNRLSSSHRKGFTQSFAKHFYSQAAPSLQPGSSKSRIRPKKQCMDPYTRKVAKKVHHEGPPVLPRESVLLVKENSTRLAELEIRSVGSQTSLKVGTQSVGSQSSSFTTDMEGCIGWNYSACSTELTASSWKSASRSQVQQSLQARIRSITRDMDLGPQLQRANRNGLPACR